MTFCKIKLTFSFIVCETPAWWMPACQSEADRIHTLSGLKRAHDSAEEIWTGTGLDLTKGWTEMMRKGLWLKKPSKLELIMLVDLSEGNGISLQSLHSNSCFGCVICERWFFPSRTLVQFRICTVPLDLRPFALRVQYIWSSVKAIFKSRCGPGNPFLVRLKTAVWVWGSASVATRKEEGLRTGALSTPPETDIPLAIFRSRCRAEN